MDFDLSAEQKMLVEGAQRYAREQLGLESRRAAAASADGFVRARYTEFAEMGWLGLAVPEADGGLGGSDVDIALLAEVLGGGLSAQPFVDTAVLGSTLIAASNQSKLRSDLLSGMSTGERITALAHVELDSRSEYDTAIQALARETPQGWRVSGAKPRVVSGAAATDWLVTARTEGSHGFAVFVIERSAAAMPSASYELVDGLRAVDLHFEDAPAHALILEPARAAAAVELALDRTIVALAAASVGSMETVMSLTSEYLKQRTQFGQTLSKFQALQHRVAEMFIETDQAHAMVYQALAALESGDDARRRRCVSGLKAFITQAGYFVTAQGIQLHGGIGITEEYAVAHHYKSILSFDKRYGDRDFHLARSMGLAAGPQ
jgi:alkylation response protein AidB-like acyl-CoA dehydrogenase